MARTSRGRQKISMKKMENESNLQVTFSKRRNGLFKKASELCILCGTEAVVVVFSPGNKVFTFGHPSVDSTVDRFLSRNPPPSAAEDATFPLMEAHRNAGIRELNARLTEVVGQVEAERKIGEELEQIRKAGQVERWWEAPIEELNLEQLHHLKEAVEDLKKDVANRVDQMVFPLDNNINNNIATNQTASFHSVAFDAAASASASASGSLQQPPPPPPEFNHPEFNHGYYSRGFF